MNRRSGSGSGLFLMEMIVAVFFFILCASTCILAFARSDNMSRTARELNQGILAAESTAEIWKTEGLDGLALRMAFSSQEDGTCETWLDQDWHVIEDWQSAAQAERTSVRPAYVVSVAVTEDGSGLSAARILVRPGELSAAGPEEIFSLEVKSYLQP